MSVIRARGTYTPSAKFTTWLYRVAHNRVIDHWRATGPVELVTANATDDDDPLDAIPGARGEEPDVQARVFDPYYSTKFLGRGLGLAAVQGIIRSHGGAIMARSNPGEGSTFQILLPVAR